jgi:lipopolysaccharide transport system ATP-binding protein
MSYAIRIENLGKRYWIDQTQERGGYRTLRESLTRVAMASWRRCVRRERSNRNKDFWALKDISFQIEPGQVVGIIGRNGAGKSTLLKILSRITKPTQGQVEFRGRVGSLLEVGTGFHPELTGRENTYLNGAILGMTRREIARKFDSIVEFSGVEKFLDTPVKRYSSGMYVRLAFAVAAHLEPEILLVDEVLSVGDLEFQKKCVGKMEEVANSGRTILLVSHHLAAVESLCSRTLVLNNGSVHFDGPTLEALDHFFAVLRGEGATHALEHCKNRRGSGEARFANIRFLDKEGHITDHVRCGNELVLEADVSATSRITRPQFCVTFSTSRGQRLFRLFTEDAIGELPALNHGGTIRCHTGPLNLMPGVYYLTLRIFSAGDFEHPIEDLPEAVSLNVLASDVDGKGRIPGSHHDVMYIPSTWDLNYN